MTEVSSDGFRAVAEAVNDAIIAAGSDGLIVFANGAATRMFGREHEALLGQPLTILMPQRYRALHEVGLTRVLETGESTLLGNAAVALHGLHADGSEFPIELSLGSFIAGDEQRFTGVIRDVSARHAQERRDQARLAVTAVLAEAATLDEGTPRLLEALASSLGFAAGALWRVDDEGTVMRAVALWQAPEVAGSEFATLSASATFARGEGLPGEVWAGGQPKWITDFAHAGLPRSDAARRSGLTSAVGVPFMAGAKVLGMIELLTEQPRERDEDMLVTLGALGAAIGQFFERKVAEEHLADAVGELEHRADDLMRSNSDLQQFAYVASHDLSEPLRTVGGFAQLLERRYAGQLDERAEEYITHIVAGVERMRALIDDLLSYARAGTEDRPLVPVDLARVTARCLDALGRAIAECDAHIEVGPLPVVTGDERMLSQVVQNLLGNALKFRHAEASPHISMGAVREGPLWRIDVADDGIGVKAGDVDRMFGMFSRLNAADAYEGTGIGLPLCRRIVQRHGGEIHARPGEAGGTVITLTLRPS